MTYHKSIRLLIMAVCLLAGSTLLAGLVPKPAWQGRWKRVGLKVDGRKHDYDPAVLLLRGKLYLITSPKSRCARQKGILKVVGNTMTVTITEASKGCGRAVPYTYTYRWRVVGKRMWFTIVEQGVKIEESFVRL